MRLRRSDRRSAPQASSPHVWPYFIDSARGTKLNSVIIGKIESGPAIPSRVRVRNSKEADDKTSALYPSARARCPPWSAACSSQKYGNSGKWLPFVTRSLQLPLLSGALPNASCTDANSVYNQSRRHCKAGSSTSDRV